MNQRGNVASCRCPLYVTSLIAIAIYQLINVAPVIFVDGQSTTDATSVDPSTNAGNDLEALRLQAKPWYAKSISYGDTIQIPISPMTIMITFLTVFYVIYYYYSTQCYCVASHILITDSSKATKAKLEQWRDKIQSNAKYASDHSECPSGKPNGGHLGKFYRHDMAPPFDQLCFDSKTKVNTTVGPVQTQFGYHLIYIHERQVPK
jgi:peptidyl-prolyl cis-trans isomerase C